MICQGIRAEKGNVNMHNWGALGPRCPVPGARGPGPGARGPGPGAQYSWGPGALGPEAQTRTKQGHCSHPPPHAARAPHASTPNVYIPPIYSKYTSPRSGREADTLRALGRRPELQRVLGGRDNRAEKGNGKTATVRRGKHNKHKMLSKLWVFNATLKQGRRMRRKVNHYQCSPKPLGLHKETGCQESARPKTKAMRTIAKTQGKGHNQREGKRRKVVCRFIAAMSQRATDGREKP